MNHFHIVPFEEVRLANFIKIDHSPISDIYLSVSEISLECKPNEILGLKLGFWTAYAPYGVVYTTRRTINIPAPYLFTASGTIPEILNELIKDLPDETTLYLFGYQDKIVELPENCPEPSTVNGAYPKLIAVIIKT